MISLRKLNLGDMEWICSELKTFSEQAGTKLPLMGDVAYIESLIQKFSEEHLFLIADSASMGPMGFLVGMFTPHLFNPKVRTAVLVVWWVSEKFRNSRAGAMLLKRFIEIGKTKADWIILGTSLDCPVKEKTITNLGFTLKEKSYFMEVS